MVPTREPEETETRAESLPGVPPRVPLHAPRQLILDRSLRAVLSRRSPSCRGNVAYVSRTTFRGFLSSRIAKNLGCLSLSAPVHSAKSMRTTTSGFTQMQDLIFSAV